MTAEPEKHERTDAQPSVVGWLAAAIALGLAASLLAAWAIIAAGVPRPDAPSLGAAGLFLHGPAEQTSLAAEWPKIDAENRAHLETYAWVDRPAGVVRIPIEQAMARVALTAVPRAPEEHP